MEIASITLVGKKWIALIRSNLSATIFLIVLGITLLTLGWLELKFMHTCGYLLAILLAAFVVELYCNHKVTQPDWKIKDSRKEFVILWAVITMRWVATLTRFVLIVEWKVSITFILMVLFIYPVFLLVYYFAMARYKPAAIGFGLTKSIWICLPLIALIGFTTYLVAPEAIEFSDPLRPMISG